MPINNVDKEELARCLQIRKHQKGTQRKKEKAKCKELLSGSALGEKFSTWVQDTQNLHSINFELNHPNSIFRAEYYIDKIISTIRRKIHRQIGYASPCDTIYLRDKTDATNLIDFATLEWEKLLLKRKKQKKCQN